MKCKAPTHVKCIFRKGMHDDKGNYFEICSINADQGKCPYSIKEDKEAK